MCLTDLYDLLAPCYMAKLVIMSRFFRVHSLAAKAKRMESAKAKPAGFAATCEFLPVGNFAL